MTDRSSNPELREARELALLIGEQVAAEAQQVLTEGEETAGQIRAAAEAEAEAIRAAARSEGEDRGRRVALRRLALAHTENRRKWLAAREELLEEVLRRARERLLRLGTFDGGTASLLDLIREGLSALPPGPVVVRLPEDYRSLLGAALAAQIGSDARPVEWQFAAVPGGGVVLETERGRLCFDNSFDARVRRKKQDLRRLAAAALLAEGA